jgi:hypothetical protein
MKTVFQDMLKTKDEEHGKFGLIHSLKLETSIVLHGKNLFLYSYSTYFHLKFSIQDQRTDLYYSGTYNVSKSKFIIIFDVHPYMWQLRL